MKDFFFSLVVVVHRDSAGESVAVGVAADVAYGGNLAGALDVATGSSGLESDVGITVVAIGVKAYVVAGARLGLTFAEAEKCLCGECCCAVRVEGTAHATADLAFHHHNAAGNGQFAVGVDAVGITGTCLYVVYATGYSKVSAGTAHAAHAAHASAESTGTIAPVVAASLRAVAGTVVSSCCIPPVVRAVDVCYATADGDVPGFKAFVGVLHIDGTVCDA